MGGAACLIARRGEIKPFGQCNAGVGKIRIKRCCFTKAAYRYPRAVFRIIRHGALTFEKGFDRALLRFRRRV